MSGRFSADARAVVTQAQEHARRLGHSRLGCEHLLLAVAGTSEPASAVLRERGITPQQVEAQIRQLSGTVQPARPLDGLDREALASIGIDLDVVRASIEASFGPGALARSAARRKRGPAGRNFAWRKGPVAELWRRRRRHGRRAADPSSPVTGHLPLTSSAKGALERSVQEAQALQTSHVGVEHIALALLATDNGMIPPILSALSTSPAGLRAGILDRYRQAS
jgi:ATP-dependent Clp protease ATP-binding subunit ClpA